MQTEPLTIIDLGQCAAQFKNVYSNIPVALVNNHVIRLSVMTEPYFWHRHPNSDESFLVVEGSVFIDLDDQTVELLPGQLFTIPRNVNHRTRPNGSRSVNITFELENMETVRTGFD
ncbi:MAG TPA: cupin domain-containing protein [Mucilaginibacter sp.]|nr:cupin domain-containing protein [Mucilaginibacter sp.]